MKPRDDTTAAIAFVPTARTPSAAESADIEVAAPPEPPRQAHDRQWSWLLPIILAVVMTGMAAMVYRSGPAAARNPTLVFFPAMMLVSACMTAVSGRGRGRAADIDESRRDYLDYLAGLRRQVTETAAAQREALESDHPEPAVLWALVGSDRMWQRRSSDPDFCRVRVGVGTGRLAAGLIASENRPPGKADPVTAAAMRRFVETHASVADVAVPVTLPEAGVVIVDGDPYRVRGLARAVVCQLALWHGPDQLRIAAVIEQHRCDDWEWLKWLPHQQHPVMGDELGAARMTYPTPGGACEALAGLSTDPVTPQQRPRLIVVVDGDVSGDVERILGEAVHPGVTILAVGVDRHRAAPSTGLRLRVDAATLTIGENENTGRQGENTARADFLSPAAALVCARRLAGYRAARPDETKSATSWLQLLGIDEPAGFDPVGAWRARSSQERLRVPIGTTKGGVAVEIDIKEAADNGMGPHGLCVGATGSGKSELLRTVALGMLARHAPEELNLVLIDFKGGATFLGLERARHVAAVITNLADEAPLVARMRDALAGEMTRRQELLRMAGNFVSIAAYDQARRAGADLPALPSLLIVVDEFSELLSQHPDFQDMFVAIGRLGRSLGVHLLLSSQRLDEGRLRGLEAHLSYRICLKTLSSSESRLALGAADAYELPNTPGAGYLRSATGELTRFQTAFVSQPCPQTGPTPAVAAETGTGPVRKFTAAPSGTVGHHEAAETANGPTVRQTVLDRLAEIGPAAHRVWLPPLETAPTVGALVDGGVAAGALTVPVGLVDRPFEQCRTPMPVDLSTGAGHAAVIGAPQSGKSTAMCTLITALAATHTPAQVQFYCLDFGGGTLESVRGLPHVGVVAGGNEFDLVGRTVAELESVVRDRETLFRSRGINSMAHYRRLRTRGDPGCGADRFGDVFLVIDGWPNLRHDFDMLEAPITALAGRGLSFGVHVVLSATRWAELRPGLKDQIGTRLELRLGDPADSEFDRRSAQQVPAGAPGRGLTPDGLHMIVAVPRLGSASGHPDPVADGAETGELLRRRYGDCTAPPVPVLPDRIDQNAVIAAGGDDVRTRIVLGLQERRLRPVALDFAEQPHLLILGDNACGKTSVLRTLCRELTRTSTAEQAQVVIGDYRRSLLGVIDSGHLGGYAASAAAVTALLPDLLDRLQQRMPGPEVTQQQLRSRSWWSGPDIYLLVDDYDLIATASGNPLTPILELLPHARDLGLRVVVARRTGGAARALYEPLLAGLRDLGCVGLMMSGGPDDGPLLGTGRPAPLPPGRGTLVDRIHGEQRIQVGWSPSP